MPLHEYECPQCGWTGDRVVKYEERDQQHCTAKLYDAKAGINLDLDEELQSAVWNAVSEEGGPLDVICDAPLAREEMSMTGPFRIDSRFQMQAITASGKKVAGNFGGGIRKKNPIFKRGLAPSKADQRKHAHKAYKKSEKHYPGRAKAEKKT